jgi:hypothetical protein
MIIILRQLISFLNYNVFFHLNNLFLFYNKFYSKKIFKIREVYLEIKESFALFIHRNLNNLLQICKYYHLAFLL